jgi:hypothetical protein
VTPISCRMSRKKVMPQQDPEYMVSHDVVPPWSPWENPFDLGGLPAKIVHNVARLHHFCMGEHERLMIQRFSTTCLD